jgi:hypothetical protein
MARTAGRPTRPPRRAEVTVTAVPSTPRPGRRMTRVLAAPEGCSRSTGPTTTRPGTQSRPSAATKPRAASGESAPAASRPNQDPKTSSDRGPRLPPRKRAQGTGRKPIVKLGMNTTAARSGRRTHPPPTPQTAERQQGTWIPVLARLKGTRAQASITRTFGLS